MKLYHKYFLYQNKLLQPYIRSFLAATAVITYVASIAFLCALIYQYGFELTPETAGKLNTLYKAVWILFLIDTSLHLMFEYKSTRKNYRKLTWILSVVLYLTLIPVIFHRPENSEAILTFWELMDSTFFRLILLLILSLLHLSNGLVRLLGKKTNPSLILAASFLIIISVGTVLLMLPRCTISGISWVDSLFISASAVCVTGLTSVDLTTTFTPEGFVVILCLFQIGGLGVMTLTSFFALFFMGNTSLYNQLVVRDIVKSSSLNSLLSTLLYTFVFTLIIETAGMLFIWLSIQGTMDMSLKEELSFAAFHSVSAFCNAGFSTLPGNLGNPYLVNNHNSFFLIISLLIILGGIGFPILVNFKEIIFYRFRMLFGKKGKIRAKSVHIYNLNTRIVMVMTALLLFSGTFFFLTFEWNNAFAGMTVAQKWTHAFFNSACTRSAGFSSADISLFSLQSILVYILFMWIGGGAQSTAGGIKVNAFAVLLLNLRSVIRGSERVEVFGREIATDSIRRANATMFMSLIALFVSVLTLSVFEQDVPLLSLLFEAASALYTAGPSLNLTSSLTEQSKLLLVVLMFVGRVGLITMMLGIVKQKKNTKYKYPSDNIIIN